MGKTIKKTPLIALENNLWYLLVSFPQELQNSSYNLSLVLSQWHYFSLFIGYVMIENKLFLFSSFREKLPSISCNHYKRISPKQQYTSTKILQECSPDFNISDHFQHPHKYTHIYTHLFPNTLMIKDKRFFCAKTVVQIFYHCF